MGDRKEERPESVPYVVYESSMARADIRNKRLIAALVTSMILLFLCNVIWLYAWMSYDYESTQTVTVDGKDGVANYIGNDGDVYNGENYSKEDAAAKEEEQERIERN